MAPRRKKLSDAVEKQALLQSGNCCAMCKTQLTIKGARTSLFSNVVEFAHIYPAGDKGPRYEEIKQDNILPEFIDSVENIMALCSSCHTKIDKLPKEYPAKTLLAIKKEHDERLASLIAESTVNITFQELQTVCDALISQTVPSEYQLPDFSLIAVKDKINKNHLSIKIQNHIKTGLSWADFIEYYLAHQNNIMFSENLVKKFQEIYSEQKKNHRGDSLYEAIWFAACPSPQNFSILSAANAVVSYLFHKCEIFEK